MSDDTETTIVKADCGHETTEEGCVWDLDFSFCPRCYQPFSMDQWPETLGKYTHRVIEGGMGVGSRTRRHTKYEYLLGLDTRGRAIYHNEERSAVKTYVPMHDDAYIKDRANRAEDVSGHVHRRAHESTLQPKRRDKRDPEPAPAYLGNFVTLPNGDHIVVVEVDRKVTRRDIGKWLRAHADEFKQIRPVHVRKYDLEDRFNPDRDGKRRQQNFDKLERIVEEVLNPVDIYHLGESPDGPWYYDKLTITRDHNTIRVADIDGKLTDEIHIDEIDDTESHEKGLTEHLDYLNNKVIDEL